MKQKLEQTKIFQGLEKFQQSLLLKKDSLKKYNDSLIQAENLGLERWISIAHPSHNEINIIKELLKIK